MLANVDQPLGEEVAGLDDRDPAGTETGPWKQVKLSWLPQMVTLVLADLMDNARA